MKAASILSQWKDCVKRQQEFRKQLALPDDSDEDYRMCRWRYRAYIKANLRTVRKELGIKGARDMDK